MTLLLRHITNRLQLPNFSSFPPPIYFLSAHSLKRRGLCWWGPRRWDGFLAVATGIFRAELFVTCLTCTRVLVGWPGLITFLISHSGRETAQDFSPVLEFLLFGTHQGQIGQWWLRGEGVGIQGCEFRSQHHQAASSGALNPQLLGGCIYERRVICNVPPRL